MRDFLIRELTRIRHDHLVARFIDQAVDDVGCGRDEIEVCLALEALAHDLHMQQTKEAAAETEAECE